MTSSSSKGFMDGGIKPVFLLARKLPVNETVNNYTMCIAGAKTSGRGSIVGSQRIGALWRIYPSTPTARLALLTKGINIAGRNLEVDSQNPFLVRNSSGEEIPSTRLTISDIPLSVSNDTIETALMKKGLKLRSKLQMEAIRDPDGKLTEWLSGRRFVWIDLPNQTIEPSIPIGQFKAKLYYREMKTEKECKRCFSKGHIASQCSKVEVCRRCKMPGHRAADCFEVTEGRDSDKELGVESETEFPSLPTVIDADNGTDGGESSADECDSMWQTVSRRKDRRRRRCKDMKGQQEKEDRPISHRETLNVTTKQAEPEEKESLSTTFTVGEAECASASIDEASPAVEDSPSREHDQTQEQSAPQTHDSEMPDQNTNMASGEAHQASSLPRQSKCLNMSEQEMRGENVKNTSEEKDDEGTIPHFFRKYRQQTSNKRLCPDTSTSSEGTPTANTSRNTVT